MKPLARLILPLLALATLSAWAEEPGLQLKDNDVWVMAGDSITAQRLHTDYIEAFFRTRFPQLHLHFRNSGIGGNRTGNTLARFDYDVAAFKPTIVSIELGMNDVNGPIETYVKGEKDLVGKIRETGARPILISSSPVDDGSVMDAWKSPRCEKLHPFTLALQKLAGEEKVTFIDQYHPLLALWGENRRKGAAAAAAKGIPAPTPFTPKPAPPGPDGVVKPAPTPVTPILPGLIPLHGDAVHTGSVGQYTMAATILKALHVDGHVSSATIGADGKVAEAKRCKITEVKAQPGRLTFTRLDECSPWPIDPQSKSAAELLPAILDLSQYILKVPGLAPGNYKVSIEGKLADTVSAQTLADGWNIASTFEGALGDRAKAINALITKLQVGENNDWRAASKAKDAEKLAAAQKAIDETEAQLQALVQPVALHFQIEK